MTPAITTSDPTIALAEYELELDNLNADIDHQELVAARNQEQSAIKQQVEKLHAAADDVRKGAWIQGGLSLAGSAADFGASTLDPGVGTTLLKSAAPGLNALAGPMGHVFGDAAQADDQADAKQAEARAADAHARAEEAEQHRQQVEQRSDRTLSTVGAIVESEAQGNLAVIANV
jgi:hypothetical protein